MSVARRKFVVVAVLVFMGLTLGAGSSLAANKALIIQGSCPDITSGTAFNITLKITNPSDTLNIAFDRVTLMYINPDMSFSGPAEGTISEVTLKPGQIVTRDVSFTVTTTQPSGTIVPIVVSLFRARLSTDPDSFRGTVVVGAKLQ